MSVGLRKPFSIGLVVLCALVVLLTLGSVPALAAAPETPELKVEAVTENAATFNGVLSPKSLGELGSTYQFLYRVSKTECKGESKAPEPPGMSLGAEGEGVSEPVSGLTPNTGYTVCLHVENAAKTEEAVSLPVHFITALEAPETLAAEPVGVTTATLKGVLSPNATVTGEPAAYEFLYRQSATECEGGEPDEDQATHVTAASGSRQEAAVPVTGLLPGAQYSFCLLERNTANETVIGPAVTFTTHGAGITEEQTTSVEATAATLQADIDPNESSTSYHFEYDTTPYTSSTSHGTSLPVPSQAIGSGTSRVSVSVRVTGLQPGTRYYYRVVAVDEIETFYGPGKALTTPVAPGSESSGGCPNEQLRAEQPYGLELPDCRAYEMVSPVEKNGQDATEGEAIDVASGAFVSRAAVSGDAIEFQSSGSFADPLGSLIADEYISRRGPEGWSTESITPPLEEYESPRLTAGAYESMVFTPELSKGVATTDAPLSSEAPAGFWELYLANFATGSYQWLSNAPTNREPYTFEGLSVLGASTDLSHVVFASYIYDALAYEWVEGKGTPTPVNVTNNGGLAGDVGDVPEGGVGNLWHAVSSDGSRVFFSNGGLYVRENAGQEQSPLDGEGNCTVSTDACTVEVSASQKTNGADPNGPRPARYWGASANGAKVFFTSSEELTDDAYTGPADNAANLYEYDLESGRLTDLTVDTADIAEGAAVQGVVQISEEGSYVYFVAKGALAPGAVAGALNLYVSH
ncbi:MAG: fibronectin type III domain-containing protein, partial [Solirubrobacteraceae bacterium]